MKGVDGRGASVALTGWMHDPEYSFAIIAPLVFLLLAVVASASPQQQTCVAEGETCTMANNEQTFIMIKPDGVARGLVGEVIKRFEQKVMFLQRISQSIIHCTAARYR